MGDGPQRFKKEIKLTHCRFNLLSNLGVNTSQLAHSISQLPSEAAAPRPRRRRAAQVQAQAAEQVPELGRGFVAAEGDIGTWGRNWHEMVILSGIEMQRQRASYQNTLTSNIWSSS